MKTPAQSAAPTVQAPVYPDFVDPAADWALGQGIDYFFLPWRQNQDWLPIAIKLQGITVEGFVTGAFLNLKEQSTLSKLIEFSKLQPKEPALLAEDEYYMASAHKDFFKLLANKDNYETLSKYVKEITLGLPLDSMSLPPKQGGPKG